MSTVVSSVASLSPLTLMAPATDGREDLKYDRRGAAVTFDLASIEQRLFESFAARFGPELGHDITAEAMIWAWEHRDELAQMKNPAGYLYRVGQSKSRRLLRWKREQVKFPQEPGRETVADRSDAHSTAPTWTEPALPEALLGLKDKERIPVILVHCFQWTYGEVAEHLEVSVDAVRNRIHRGMQQLRSDLGACV